MRVLSLSGEVNMQLQSVSLRGRRFLIQFQEMMTEFGNVIPWLDGLDELRFATNGEWFRDRLLQRLGQRNGVITPYQFVNEGEARIYSGGILLFEQSPETLHDRHNGEIAERLASDGARFISCLQVCTSRRGSGIGNRMMPRAIRAIQAEHGAVWGVVSDPRLLPWYAALGAQTPSPLDNTDGLWIVHWPKPVQQS